MAAVAVALLTRPPSDLAELPGYLVPESTLEEISADAFEIVTDTDKLLTACSCTASSDQVYNN